MAERLVLRALRKEDLLDLTFELVNVQTEGARLVRVDGAEPALLIVHFPPQHVAEEAFHQNEAGTLSAGPAPIRALLSGPSRLVFRLPDDQSDWPLTLATLLDWRAYTPVLAPNALPPGTTMGPGVAQPTPEQTALEIPTGLVMSPDQTGGWAHSVAAVEHDARYELWQTRLGLRSEAPGPTVREDRARFVRAIWTSNPSVPFNTSLTAADRTDIVRLTSDFSLPQVPHQFAGNPMRIAQWRWLLDQYGMPRKYVPQPVQVRHLMLSASGAWANFESAWDYPTIIAGQNDGLGYPQLALEQWQHIAAQSRDQFVKTVQKAFLCDPAHRASIITITEREFQPLFIRTEPTPTGPVSVFGSTAFLRQYQYVEVQEPIKDYTPLAAAYTYSGREMPVRRIHITTRSTPMLDVKLPENAPAWPMVGGKPFPFQMVVEDGEGQTATCERPLMVVPLRAITSAASWKTIVDTYNAPAQVALRTSQLSAQPIALAETEPDTRGKTTLTTETLESTAQLVSGPKIASLPTGHPLFLPSFRAARVNLPSVERLLGRPTSVEIVFDPTYLNEGLTGPNNRGEVFATLTQKLDLPFGAEKAGGLVKPDTTIQALSRSLGPVANPTAIKQGKFDISAFDKARFLGGITLRDILQPVAFNPQQLGVADLPAPELAAQLADPSFHLEVPRLTSQERFEPGNPVPVGIETRFLWKPVVKEYADGLFAFEVTPGRTQLVLQARLFTPLDGTPSTYEVDGRLEAFALNFAGALRLTFTALRFSARGGQKMDMRAEGVALEFDGPLKFVDTLKDILPANGFSDGPSLEVTAAGVRAGYTLGVPTVGVGIFSLQNLSLSAGLSLPFVDQPAGVRFAISERQKPFLVSVALFGGGGFFALGLNARGIEQIEAAIEFGGNLSLDLGVASGGVYVMAGIYFSMTGTEVKLTGYLRMGGYLSVLGIISISIEFYLGFTYRAKGSGGEAWGRASVSVCVKIAFFSTSVSLTIERKFAGAAGDPTFVELVEPDDWEQYCAAFA
jgi:hypothetical protein